MNFFNKYAKQNKLKINTYHKDDNSGKVIAVVVTYNRKELLKECIEALNKQEEKNLQILIIDNASTDGTKEYISKLIDGEKMIYKNTGENLGGAGGFNFGVKEAMAIGCDYVWLMDDDCIVQKDSLTELLKFAVKIENNFGYLSSVVNWQDGSICKMNRQRTSLFSKVKDFTNDQEITIASFVSLLVKKEAIEACGLPIKDFFIWGDDVEYTARLSQKFKNYLVAKSVVIHKSAKNFGVDITKESVEKLDRYFYAYRNEKYLYSKLGISGKAFYFLKVLKHRIRILLSRIKHKKARLKLISKAIKAGKSFKPQIEYCDENKLRILEYFAMEKFAYGGQESFIINMLKNFDMSKAKYFCVSPFTCTNENLIKLADEKSICVLTGGYSLEQTRDRLRGSKMTLKLILQDNKFDVIHIHTGSAWALLNAARTAKKHGIKKIIVHSHCAGVNNLKHLILKSYTDLSLNKFVDEYLACSKLAGEWKFPKKIIKKDRCLVVNNGIDIEKYRFQEASRQEYRQQFGIKDEIVLCNVGRFEYQKNHDFIVKIAQILARQEVNFKFILVGTGVLKNEIEKKVNNLQLNERFIFLENRNDIAQIMMASDVFVMPSHFEGFPVTLIESQATGLWSVAADTITAEADLTDIIKFLPIADAKIWADYIVNNFKVVKDRAKYADVVAKTGYSSEASAKLLEDIYFQKKSGGNK